MTRRDRLAAALRRGGHALGAPFRGLWSWQAGIPDAGRVVLVGLALLAGGLVAAGLPALALAVPGGILVFLGTGSRPSWPTTKRGS